MGAAFNWRLFMTRDATYTFVYIFETLTHIHNFKFYSLLLLLLLCSYIHSIRLILIKVITLIFSYCSRNTTRIYAKQQKPNLINVFYYIVELVAALGRPLKWNCANCTHSMSSAVFVSNSMGFRHNFKTNRNRKIF